MLGKCFNKTNCIPLKIENNTECQSKNIHDIDYVNDTQFRTYENIRFYGHYKYVNLYSNKTSVNESKHELCRKECIQHKNCEASTLIVNICYLYDKNFVHNCFSQEIGVKTYSRIKILNNYGKFKK